MNEVEALGHLKETLQGLGYPEESIRFEFSVNSSSGRRRYIDVAIIDPASNDVVAIIEVKNGNKQNALNSAAQQVASYARLLPYGPLSFVYVYDHGNVQIGKVNEENFDVTLLSSFPRFSSLVTGSRAENKIEVRSKSNVTGGNLERACCLLGILILNILIFDISDIYKFSSQQLTLLGILVGLLVIPFAAKFKLLGMEFEWYSGGKNNHT